MKHEKLSYRAVALGLGMTWGIILLLIGFLSIYGWGTDIVHLLSSLHCGYGPTFFGALLGAISGFVDGALFGLLFVFFHNLALSTIL